MAGRAVLRPLRGWRHLLAWVLRRRRRVRVVGQSMVPVLHDGDHVLVDERARRPRPGAVVWIIHPARPDLALVKRVLRVEPDGALYVVGDNPRASTDSRQLGPLPAELLRGTVVWRFPDGRSGPPRPDIIRPG